MSQPTAKLVFVSLKGLRWSVNVHPALLDSPLARFPFGVDCVTVYPRGNAIAVCAWVGFQVHEYRIDGKYVIRNRGRGGPGFIHGTKSIADGAARHIALRKYVRKVCARVAGVATLPQ